MAGSEPSPSGCPCKDAYCYTPRYDNCLCCQKRGGDQRLPSPLQIKCPCHDAPCYKTGTYSCLCCQKRDDEQKRLIPVLSKCPCKDAPCYKPGTHSCLCCQTEIAWSPFQCPCKKPVATSQVPTAVYAVRIQSLNRNDSTISNVIKLWLLMSLRFMVSREENFIIIIKTRERVSKA